jgi:hypothetical protein
MIQYKYFTSIVLFLAFSNQLSAQVFSDKVVGKRNQTLSDSIKSIEYPYVLPILGKKAAKAGFDLPYSAGLGINYLWQKSDITINNLKVGINNGPMYDLDEVVQFNNATATSSGINFRPDVWVFPFLNVYGILAASKSSTAIDIDVRIPTDPGQPDGEWKSIANFQTKAEFQGTTAGFGLTPTIGIAGGWGAFDMNFSWTDIDALDKPAFAYVFGPRFGKAFRLKQPEQNISFWVGGFRVHLNSATYGSLPLSDVISTPELQTKIDNGYAGINEAQTNVDTWWNGLTPAEQKRPSNVVKKETADRTISKASQLLDGVSNAATNLSKSSVQYSLDKKQTSMWNFIVGTQFQYNKHWMIRGEIGLLGSRTQTIIGLQYRFGL